MAMKMQETGMRADGIVAWQTPSASARNKVCAGRMARATNPARPRRFDRAIIGHWQRGNGGKQ